MGFVHDEDFSETPDFTLDDVRAETRVAVLLGWLDETRDNLDDMKIQVEAAKLCDSYDDEWMERIRHAMSFVGIGKHRLEKRLKALGVNPHPPALRDELHDVKAENARLRANMEKARVSAEFGRHFLEAVKAAVSPPLFDAISADAACRASVFVEQVAREAA